MPFITVASLVNIYYSFLLLRHTTVDLCGGLFALPTQAVEQLLAIHYCLSRGDVGAVPPIAAENSGMMVGIATAHVM